MMQREICHIALRALPLMSANARDEARQLIAELDHDPEAHAAAVAAFHRDMRPVCGAIVSALEAGDIEALSGLRGLLPHYLAEVNRAPALAGVLAHQLGRAFLAGLGVDTSFQQGSEEREGNR